MMILFRRDWERIDAGYAILHHLQRVTEKIMATLKDVNDKLDTLTGLVSSTAADLQTGLKDLQDEILALKAGTVTQADLDAIAGKLTPMIDNVANMDATIKGADPGPQPAPAP